MRTLLERDRQATYVVIKRRLYEEESHTQTDLNIRFSDATG